MKTIPTPTAKAITLYEAGVFMDGDELADIFTMTLLMRDFLSAVGARPIKETFEDDGE